MIIQIMPLASHGKQLFGLDSKGQVWKLNLYTQKWKLCAVSPHKDIHAHELECDEGGTYPCNPQCEKSGCRQVLMTPTNIKK